MISLKRLLFAAMVALSIMLAFSSDALAQSIQGSILGTVSDHTFPLE